MQLESLLSGLREIHIPEPVSIWPLAPIWWIGLLLIIATIVLNQIQRRRRKDPVFELAFEQLNTLRRAYREHQSTAKTCAQLSQLLRRVALALEPRQDIAKLTGQQWLQWLDKKANMQDFSQGIGQVIITAPYQPQPDIDVNQLFKLVRRWIKQTHQVHS